MKPIIIVSDTTCEIAERIVRATLLHFDDSQVSLSLHARVRVGDDIKRIVEKAEADRALVVYTIIGAAPHGQFLELVERYQVEAVDLLGGLMTKVTGHLGQKPTGAPGLLHAIGEDYYRRIEAVEFTVKHDDGAEPEDLPKADLVLVGVSRTTKTPLSVYLAQKGLCVANVPLVLGIEPPVELDQCDQRRIFGLTIGADALVRIRSARLKHLGMTKDAAYGTREHIKKELAYANEIFAAHPSWPIIDVTNKAIEENAADILQIHKERGGKSAVALR